MIRNPYRDTLTTRSFWFAGRELEVRQQPENRLELTGNVVWDGALIFCKFLERQPKETFVGKELIELGAGTGVVGLVTGFLGASVTITDLDCQLDLIRKNVEQNDPQHSAKVRVARLRWGDKSDLAALSDRKFDLLLCCETIFDDRCFKELLETLDALCTHSTQIMIAYTERHPKEKAFWKEFDVLFVREEVSLAFLPEEFQSDGFHIYRCHRRRSESTNKALSSDNSSHSLHSTSQAI